MGLKNWSARLRNRKSQATQIGWTFIVAGLPLFFVLAGGIALFPASRVIADGGTIYAVILLTNATPPPGVVLHISQTHTSTEWNLNSWYRQFYQGDIMMPDSSPPLILAPGQTMVWGTASNGGFLATTGTGGSLFINEASTTISWSVPWTAENLGPPLPGCSYSIKKNSGGSAFTQATISGGLVGNSGGTVGGGSNSCEFSFGAQ